MDTDKMTLEQLEAVQRELNANPERNPAELREQYLEEVKQAIQKRTRGNKQQEREEILY